MEFVAGFFTAFLNKKSSPKTKNRVVVEAENVRILAFLIPIQPIIKDCRSQIRVVNCREGRG